MKWPEYVPILKASDIIRDDFTKGQKHCLLGWKYAAKGNHTEGIVSRRINTVLCEAAKEMGLSSNGYGVAGYNDDRRNTKAQLAECWNRAMAKLGYTEIVDA